MVMDLKNSGQPLALAWGYLCSNQFAFQKNSLAEKEAKYHEVVDLAVWNALNLSDTDSSTVVDDCSSPTRHSRRLPTALAKLSLQYFSPWY